MSQQSWLQPEQDGPVAIAIEAYFYQAPSPSVIEIEALTALPEPEEPDKPLAERITKHMAEIGVAETQVALEQARAPERADRMAEMAAEQAHESESLAELTSRGSGTHTGTLLERSRQYLQPEQDLALQHQARQQQQHSEPKITVAPRFQEIPRDPARQVVAQLDDGLQIIRTRDGCRLADPSKDGFAALMAARRVACGDEDAADAGQQLQQILQRRSRRIEP
ncbi:hypothetical protein [Alkalimonas sp.]|uniref:hypothetical protein n=1 Tax=Alkalimonas sp. TaxID=1872453 RepID=UPI00263BC833|nr:hypothetical protein [Alkalimonas sp.]MCC5826766.1 hypothetical protein [Alkalimonas sp.]